MMMERRSLFASIAASLLAVSRAQTGPALCACQPSFYQFTLNYAQTCGESDVEGTPGVESAPCLLNTLGENVTDLVPVGVQRIVIVETDQLGRSVGQKILMANATAGVDPDGFPDLFTFNYTSVTALNSSSINNETLPMGLSVFLSGVNAENQTVINFFAIDYTNDCTIYPVLQVGQQIGWTFFSMLGSATGQFCPISTTPPTMSPTGPPITATGSPTASPSGFPTVSPTPLGTTGLPTVSPTPLATTGLPTVSPTPLGITRLPTVAPTPLPTSSPTPLGTPSPATVHPTRRPTQVEPTSFPSCTPTTTPTTSPDPKARKGTKMVMSPKSPKAHHPKSSKHGVLRRVMTGSRSPTSSPTPLCPEP